VHVAVAKYGAVCANTGTGGRHEGDFGIADFGVGGISDAYDVCPEFIPDYRFVSPGLYADF
jgi:hypothetical protein